MLMNLTIGLPTMLLCLIMQAAVTFWTVRHYVRQMSRVPPGHELLAGIRQLLGVMILLTLGNFCQIVVWGTLFFWLGEFATFDAAVYHSAVNFTSLGYGDLIMSAQRKLLGPLEAVNGILMLGMTGAALMAILQHLIKERFAAPQR